MDQLERNYCVHNAYIVRCKLVKHVPEEFTLVLRFYIVQLVIKLDSRISATRTGILFLSFTVTHTIIKI